MNRLSCRRSLPLTLSCILLALTTASCLKPKPMNNLGNLKHEYLDGLFLAKPHLATYMGDHRFDERVVDLSPRGQELRQRVLEQQKLRLASLDKKQLALNDEIDVEIMSDGIELELLYLREIRDWEWDPRLHDSFPYYDPREIVASRISDIIHGDFAPEQERLRSITGQMQNLPGLLSQMKSCLKNPSKIYTQQAIEDNKGRISLFQTEVAEFIAKAPGIPEDSRIKAETIRRNAVEALGAYQKFLETELLPRSNGDWRLGAERFRKKFPLALQTRMSLDQVVSRAEWRFKETRQEYGDLAARLHKELLPGRVPGPSGSSGLSLAAQSSIIRDVKGNLSKDHPTADGLVEAHRRNLDDFRNFIEQHNLLKLPPRETLQVKEMPAFKRGVAAAEYLAPGVLEGKAQWQATYYVDPVNSAWDTQKIESYLRANNIFEVQLTAMHEAYPGHHTQYFYSRQSLNPLRSVLWNAAFVEGWAVYGENLMVRLGFGGEKNPRYRFFELQGDMIVSTNAIIDIKLHTGQMTEQEAVDLMMNEGFQEKAQAEKKLHRAQLDTTQLSQYFLGYEEILELERDYRQKKGVAFNQREFDESLIGHGSIAVKYLRKYLLTH